MRILVTGANGFIGRALRTGFADLGHAALGVDIAGGDGVVEGDTAHPAAWAHMLQGVDVVIHTAAIVSTVAPLQRAWQVNVAGTKRVLDAAVDAGVPHLIFLSSVAVWGDDFPDGVTEEDPPRVQGHSYADTKINGEAVVLAAHAAGRIDVTVIRPGDVYGPGSRPWVVLPLEVIRRGVMVLPEHGRGVFSPVYIDDLVSAIVLAATCPAARGQVFTITSGAGVPCAEYFGRLAEMVGGSVRTGPTRPVVALMATAGRAERALGRPSELSANAAGMLTRTGTYSIGKARRLLGYEPRVDLDEGMVRTRAWLLAEGLL